MQPAAIQLDPQAAEKKNENSFLFAVGIQHEPFRANMF